MIISQLSRGYSHGRKILEQLKSRLDIPARRERKKFLSLRKSYYNAYWRDVTLAYAAQIEEVGYDIIKISKLGQHTFVRNWEVMLDNHLSLNMMGNKPLTHKLLKQEGYPIPKNLVFTLSTLSSACRFQEELRRQVVVKPAGGGAGKGVTTKIGDARRLKKAAQWASIFHPRILVEEQIPGDSYRLLYLGGRLIDAIRRDPPSVIGDGSSSIRKLISQENFRRLNSPTVISLSPIGIDMDCKNKLREQSLSLKDILDMDQVVIVKDVINQNSARENHIIPESEIHPSTISLGSKIAVDFGLELIGLDIICEDISLPLEESGGVINEVNTTPGLHHHELVAEQASRADVGKQILDYVFSRQSATEISIRTALNAQ